MQETIRSVSAQHGVDPKLVWAMIRVESNFNPRAVSHKGAMGLMQIMPETARLYGVKDPHDPIQNIRAGVQHLTFLMGYFKGDLRLVLGAYNSGVRAVEQLNSMSRYPETKKYIADVLGHYRSAAHLPSR
ncbi:MAG: lytic transglycosylase domain-containing protein [Deltaproteobacteria bacterium]|nr:lytic transglycosylase domain-containing protein [Deltaproteobacteria bacterium]